MTTGLFVGRFQPFHRGHLATVKFALKSVNDLVIVVGSAQKSHEQRNPFTAGERIAMIRAALKADKDINNIIGRIMTIPVIDVDVHSLWTRQVDMLVPRYDVVFANDPFTLFLFREQGIRTVEPPLKDRNRLMATEVRRRMAEGGEWQELVPEPVAKVIGQIGGLERVKAVTPHAHDHGHE
ncbi:MAG TPA: nicotinamide-nucleotide adenylyltransferase, partial [Nitrososphaera sp.]|nr:nicotinamide-nucleotide adenylyltransferase [Nitrososphaera sp.]